MENTPLDDAIGKFASGRYRRNREFVFALLICITLSLPISAQTVAEISYPQSKQHLLISYSVSHEMVMEDDPTPLLRIYGDGRVLVHRPVYMKSSGDFEMMLTQAELQALCRQMIERKTMSFRNRDAQQQLREQQTQSGLQYSISDSSEVEIRFDPRSIRFSNHANKRAVSAKHHRIRNLRARARWFPEIRSYVDMAEVESLLTQYLYSPRLVRLR